MSGSVDLYVLACTADGFEGIGVPHFLAFLQELSKRSLVSVSELEDMCCKLKAFGDASGWSPSVYVD